MVSPTSWSADEPFEPLLEALEHIESPTLFVLTGRGPERAQYEGRFARAKSTSCQVVTGWLELADYRALLGAADLGLCMHTSSSKVDLPMKVLDMFGAGLPVLAYDYGPCLGELVRDGHNGRLFTTGRELATHIDGLARDPSAIARLAHNILDDPGEDWHSEWQNHARWLFE